MGFACPAQSQHRSVQCPTSAFFCMHAPPSSISTFAMRIVISLFLVATFVQILVL
jgi:hypothetical protein